MTYRKWYDKIRNGYQTDSISHSPRTCLLTRKGEHTEYGFYLYQEDSNPDQIIGIVDEGSSADKAGLKVEDMVLQVNDIDVNNKTHAQVIEMMKTNPLEIKLLVVNRRAKQCYEEQKKRKRQSSQQSRPFRSLSEDGVEMEILNGYKD